jgi:hypothetical protein
LYIDDFACRKIELDNRNSGCLQVSEKAYFGWLQEHEGAAFAVGTTGCSSDAVDIISRIIRWVELNNPWRKSWLEGGLGEEWGGTGEKGGRTVNIWDLRGVRDVVHKEER